MASAFSSAFAKLALLGQFPDQLTDCSEVIPVPKPFTGAAMFPAGLGQNNVEQAVYISVLSRRAECSHAREIVRYHCLPHTQDGPWPHDFRRPRVSIAFKFTISLLLTLALSQPRRCCRLLLNTSDLPSLSVSIVFVNLCLRGSSCEEWFVSCSFILFYMASRIIYTSFLVYCAILRCSQVFLSRDCLASHSQLSRVSVSS